FGGPMMSVDEAVGIITARVTPVQEIETVALLDADGRVLARDIAAPLPLPPFTNSAVDGYAVRSSDLSQGQEHDQEKRKEEQGQEKRKEDQAKERALPVTGRAQAGGAAQAAQPGHAVRIFTGAPMPQGTDTVFMQEDVRIDESGRVVVPRGLNAGAHVRPAGEDVALGHLALRAGVRLKPQHIALAAAFGLTELPVMRRIRVAVFSTGDELASPGTSRAAAQLFDSNRFMLAAMLRRLGATVSDLGI